MAYRSIPERENERFWRQVDRRSANECWEWRGCFSQDGRYGSARYRGTLFRAHRLAFVLNGGIIPDGLVLCHSCDNTRCCNPAHLWVGTQADNIHDWVMKGKDRSGRKRLPKKGIAPVYFGKMMANARLNPEAVKVIRSLAPIKPLALLASIHGIGLQACKYVVSGRTWSAT